jgi:hypothetical protein
VGSLGFDIGASGGLLNGNSNPIFRLAATITSSERLQRYGRSERQFSHEKHGVIAEIATRAIENCRTRLHENHGLGQGLGSVCCPDLFMTMLVVRRLE